ncbi:unnamed protein product, partial [Closterium sp. NIES-54]
SKGLGFAFQCVHFEHPSAGGCQRSISDPRLILGKSYMLVVMGGYGRIDPLLNKPFYPNGLVVGILTCLQKPFICLAPLSSRSAIASLLARRHFPSHPAIPSHPAVASPLVPPSPPLSRPRLPSHPAVASPLIPTSPPLAVASPLILPSPALSSLRCQLRFRREAQGARGGGGIIMVLLTIIRKLKRKEREMRILMVGLDNAGKTTIVMRFNGQDTSQVGPTLGFSITTLRYKGFNLNVWDVGGQRTLRAYWRNYFERTDGLVWVVDSCDRLRLTDCRDELHRVLLEERLAGASLLVLANKQDLSGALSTEEMSEVLGLKALAEGRRHCHLVPCSAKTGEGVLRGFEWLVTDIASRIYMFD